MQIYKYVVGQFVEVRYFAMAEKVHSRDFRVHWKFESGRHAFDVKVFWFDMSKKLEMVSNAEFKVGITKKVGFQQQKSLHFSTFHKIPPQKH